MKSFRLKMEPSKLFLIWVREVGFYTQHWLDRKYVALRKEEWPWVKQLLEAKVSLRDSTKSYESPKLPAAKVMSASVLKGLSGLFTMKSTTVHLLRHSDALDSHNVMKIASSDSVGPHFLGQSWNRKVGLVKYNPWLWSASCWHNCISSPSPLPSCLDSVYNQLAETFIFPG